MQASKDKSFHHNKGWEDYEPIKWPNVERSIMVFENMWWQLYFLYTYTPLYYHNARAYTHIILRDCVMKKKNKFLKSIDQDRVKKKKFQNQLKIRKGSSRSCGLWIVVCRSFNLICFPFGYSYNQKKSNLVLYCSIDPTFMIYFHRIEIANS